MQVLKGSGGGTAGTDGTTIRPLDLTADQRGGGAVEARSGRE